MEAGGKSNLKPNATFFASGEQQIQYGARICPHAASADGPLLQYPTRALDVR